MFSNPLHGKRMSLHDRDALLPLQALAFCCGQHKRLGCGSWAAALPTEVLRKICESLSHLYVCRVRATAPRGNVTLYQYYDGSRGPSLCWMRENGLLLPKYAGMYENFLRQEPVGFFAKGEEYFLSGHQNERQFSFLLFTYEPRTTLYAPRRDGLLSYLAGSLKAIIDGGRQRVLYKSAYECEIGNHVVVRYTERSKLSSLQIFFFGAMCIKRVYNCRDVYLEWEKRGVLHAKQCCAGCRSRHGENCYSENCHRSKGKGGVACECFTVKNIVLRSSSFAAGGQFWTRATPKNGMVVRRQHSYDRSPKLELLVL